jgi:hypothetical protein
MNRGIGANKKPDTPRQKVAERKVPGRISFACHAREGVYLYPLGYLLFTIHQSYAVYAFAIDDLRLAFFERPSAVRRQHYFSLSYTVV